MDVVLPPEVLAACKPLHCELCKASMNSPAMTKSHYEGKGHEKKVRAVLATKGQGTASTANTHYRGGEILTFCNIALQQCQIGQVLRHMAKRLNITFILEWRAMPKYFSCQVKLIGKVGKIMMSIF